LWHPNGTQENVFYVGANGQVYNWNWSSTAWSNANSDVLCGAEDLKVLWETSAGRS